MSFPTPADIAQEYLNNLATLKPGEVDIDSEDNDWFIRAQVTGGVVSGAYNDLQLLEDDIFPQSARHDAIGRHLFTYFPPPNNTFKPATSARGPVKVSGTPGTQIPVSMILTFPSNGNQYQPSSQTTLDAATGLIDVVSTAQGQSQNLGEGATLTISNPPAGLDSTGQVFGAPLSDGSNAETDDAAAARVLARLQSPPAGGNEADYKNYALAVPGVTDANVIRFIYGLGTVGVMITAGTTDIDAAINAGQPIIRTPSQTLLDEVLAALIAQVPETDCAYTIPPSEVAIDVKVEVAFTIGDQDTVPAGQTLTQGQLVIREVQRAVYKTPPGGRKFGSQGYVVASDIEETLDNNLGNTPYSQGQFAQILSDRQVEALTATGFNRLILPFQLAKPGTITLESL